MIAVEGRPSAEQSAASERKQHFLVVLTHSLHVRNFLSSGALSELAGRGHRLSVVVVNEVLDEVRGQVERIGTGTLVEPLNPYLGGWWRERLRRWFRVASIVQRRSFDTYRHKIWLARWSPGFLFKALICRIVCTFADLEETCRAIERRIPPTRRAAALVETLRPDVIFYATLLHDGRELELVKAAQRQGVRSVGFPASWDTLTSKGLFLIRPNCLLVWGNENVRHAVEYHGFSPDSVVATGAAHFDVYGPSVPIESREVFLSRRGIDPAKRLILLAGTTITYWEDEPLQLRALSAAAASGDLKDCVIWYRPHPRRAYRDIVPLCDLPCVYVDDQMIRQKTKGAAAYSTRPEDLLHYRNLLEACEGVIAAFSTMIIEGALLGKPSLVVGFGLGGHASRRLLEHGKYEHMRDVLRTPGVTLCRSLKELVDGTRDILGGRFAPLAGALRARAGQIAHNLDGRGRDRIIAALEHLVAERGSHR